MKSIWNDAIMPRFEQARGEMHTDVLIIGGGAAGLLTAHFLRREGVPCTVVEKERICSGVTHCTTAKLTAQHGFIYDKLIRKKGLESARTYWRVQSEALEEYRRLAKNIPCDFEERDNIVYTKDRPVLGEREYAALQLVGADAFFEKDIPLPVGASGAVGVRRQAQFHPLKFFGAIAADLPIFEHTFVRELVGTTAITDTATIHAKRVVVATHFPFLNKHGAYFLKLYQHRSYVLALRGAPLFDGMYVDAENGGISARTYKDLLLLGGCGNRTGKPSGAWDALREFAKHFAPHAEEVCAFATQDCMTLDGLPYVGQYGKRTKDMYVVTGFGKWGMTNAMSAAMLLTDCLLGRQNSAAALFDPARSVLHPQLALNAAGATANLLSLRRPRCPHLGCALVWNKAEHTYDCPCHGSRFAEDGTLLDNPANGDLPPKNT